MPQPSVTLIDASGTNRTVFTLNPNGPAVEANSQPMVLPQTQVDALVAGRASETTSAAIAHSTATIAGNTAGKATEATQLEVKTALNSIAVSAADAAASAKGKATEATAAALAASAAKLATNSDLAATEATLADLAASAKVLAANSAGKATDVSLLAVKASIDAAVTGAVANSAGKATDATLLRVEANTARAAASSAAGATEATLGTIAASVAASAANSGGKATEATLRAAALSLDGITAALSTMATASTDKKADAILSDIATSSATIASNSAGQATEATLAAAKFALGVLATHAAKAAASGAASATEATLAAAASALSTISTTVTGASTEATQQAVKSLLAASTASAAISATNSASAASEATVSEIAANTARLAVNSAAAATEATMVDIKLALEAIGANTIGTAPETKFSAASSAGTAAAEVLSCQGVINGTPIDSRITSSATARTLGLVATTTGYGTLRVTAESGSLFSDNLAGSVLDTADRWNAPNVSGDFFLQQNNGVVEISSTTTNGASIELDSKPFFAPVSSGFLDYSCSVKLEARVAGLFALNQHRFWGFGDRPVALGTEAPLNNAVGFEIGTNGQLCCVVYVGGVNKFRAAATQLKAAINTIVTPAAAFTRFGVTLRADTVLFYVGTTEYPAQVFTAASADFSPLRALPLRIAATAAPSGTIGRSTFQLAAINVGDTAANGKQISDGTYPWRKATVDAQGRLAVSTAAIAPTYQYSQTGLAPTGPVVAIEASAAKPVVLKRVRVVSGTATAADIVSLVVARTTAPGTDGAVKVDSAMNRDLADPIFGGTVRGSSFTAGPSTPTYVSFDVPVPSAGNLPQVVTVDLTNGGTLEGFVVPAGTGCLVTHPGRAGLVGFGISVEWAEGA